MSSCRAAGERRPESKWEEGPGETKAVSPGPARKRWHLKKEAPDESGTGDYGTLPPLRNYAALCFFGCTLFLSNLDERGRLLRFADALRLGRLRLWRSEYGLGLGQWVGFVFAGDADVVDEGKTQGKAG